METVIRHTRSVCPVCLRNLPACLTKSDDGQVLLNKTCPEHGSFRVPVWQGMVDWDQWLLETPPLSAAKGLCCPESCGLCSEHESGSCCVLLEVTARCNLRCRFCFARGGERTDIPDPDLGELKRSIRDIVQQCGQPLLQLSGGEPTLRDDLDELVRFAREAGCSYVQLNTNGIRLAQEPKYAERLAEAGLDIVFLQFDGTRDEVYETLRGAALLETKTEAIRICGALGIGVTLVPTVVPGVNDSDLGDLVALACRMAPAVRGIHFQPVSYFGRYPSKPEDTARYTLDRLMADLSAQAGIPLSSFMPSRCDHPLCGFHSVFLPEPSGRLRPLSSISHSSHSRGSARDNREYVARHWRRAPAESAPVSNASAGLSSEVLSDEMDFDTFLYRLRHESLTLSAMAFQDAMNLNIERLHRCSLHVYDHGKVRPFCAKYLSPFE
ncbi:MAG: radical SAM protein [Oscillospiraceae bacterium]|nr:radical SAM protein [Oscillospiraceae bacterium]